MLDGWILAHYNDKRISRPDMTKFCHIILQKERIRVFWKQAVF